MKSYLLSLIIIFGVTSTAFSQVAINTSGANPDESAVLDVSAADKGLLIPRVNITDVDSDMSPVENPAEGLLVYNIGTTDEIPQGFYYWTESKWTGVTSGNSIFTTYQQSQMYEAAEMYEDNDLSSPSTRTLPNSNNYYGWVSALEGETFGSTITDLEDLTADKIIVGEDGLYKVEISMSFSGTNNFQLETSVFHTPASTGEAVVTKTRIYRKLAALDIGSGSTHGLIRLEAGDALDIRFKGSSWGETINIFNMNMIVNKVGELE